MKILINGKENPNIKAIQVDDYWVIVDTEVKIKERKKEIIYHKNINQVVWSDEFSSSNPDCFKIIASINKQIDKSIPVIKFVKQSVEELAVDYLWKDWSYIQCPKSIFINNPNEPLEFKKQFEAYISGYNQAKFSNKKYTQADMINAFNAGTNSYIDSLNGNWSHSQLRRDELKNIFIQSLNQPKLPDVIELEMEELYFKRNSLDDGFKGNWEQIAFTNYNYSITNPESLHHRWKEYKKEIKLKTTSTPEGEIIEIKI